MADNNVYKCNYNLLHFIDGESPVKNLLIWKAFLMRKKNN